MQMSPLIFLGKWVQPSGLESPAQGLLVAQVLLEKGQTATLFVCAAYLSCGQELANLVSVSPFTCQHYGSVPARYGSAPAHEQTHG